MWEGWDTSSSQIVTQTKSLNTTSFLSSDHSTGITSNVVKQIVENCETAEDVL